MTLGDLGQAIAQQAGALNQQMAQMNSHLRTAAGATLETINGFYGEARRFVKSFDEQRGLRYRPATIQLSSTIAAAQSGSADFRVAMNEDFIVHEIRTFINLNDIANEPNGAAFVVPVTMNPLELAQAKALNATFSLINKDTKVPIMENANIGFASLCPEVGGHAMKFNPDIVPGFIIPHNVTMQALFNLVSNANGLIQRSTTYGVALTGVYMSRDRY